MEEKQREISVYLQPWKWAEVEGLMIDSLAKWQLQPKLLTDFLPKLEGVFNEESWIKNHVKTCKEIHQAKQHSFIAENR